MRTEREATEKELAHLRRRNETLKSDFEQEKQVGQQCDYFTLFGTVFFTGKVCFKGKTQCLYIGYNYCTMQCEVSALQEQLSQQADYCAAMGAACCTLLWRVSRQEDCIQSILTGVNNNNNKNNNNKHIHTYIQSMVSDFFQLGASTLQSYLDAYNTDTLPDECSLESQFVLALCGTITSKLIDVCIYMYACMCVSGQYTYIPTMLEVTKQLTCTKYFQPHM